MKFLELRFQIVLSKLQKVVLTLCTLFLSGQGLGQVSLTSNGLHRVFISRADTSYEFYASIPEKKNKVYPDKMYFWYRSDTILITRGAFDGRLLNGEYKEFYTGKNLKVKGRFVTGLKDGQWMFWYPTGQIQKIEYWKKGARFGYVKNFNWQGMIVKEQFYKNDFQTGRQIQFDTTRKTYDTTYFKKGVIVGKDSLIKNN